MRYTRLEVQSKNRNSSTKIIMQFFILIPLIAIIVGSTATRFIIMPYMSKSLPKSSTASKTAAKLKKIDKIVFLQAGVFSNKDNAELLLKGIKEKNFGAYLVSDKDEYRIVIAFSDDEKNLNEQSKELKAAGYNTFLNYIELQKLDKNTPEELKAIKEYADIIANTIEYQINCTENATADKNDQKYSLDTLTAQIKSNYTTLNKLSIAEDKRKEIDDFNSHFLSKYSNFIDECKKDDAEVLKNDIADEIITFYNLYKSISSLYVS